jgi:single-strand DNA-binding protein
MTQQFQQIIVRGNLGKDPQQGTMPSGQEVSNFPICNTQSWVDSNGNSHEFNTWFKVEVMGNLAAPCNLYLHKGSDVLVVGRMVGDQYGNPKVWNDSDGNPRANFIIRATKVEFLNKSNGNDQQTAVVTEDPTEGIPF